jgi:prevent-host-death family protein
MKFINIRELSKSPSKYIKRANEDGDVIITRNGKPYAVISKMDGKDLEDFILAKHFDLERQFKQAIKDYQSGHTSSAHQLLHEIEDNSSNEIQS